MEYSTSFSHSRPVERSKSDEQKRRSDDARRSQSETIKPDSRSRSRRRSSRQDRPHNKVSGQQSSLPQYNADIRPESVRPPKPARASSSKPDHHVSGLSSLPESQVHYYQRPPSPKASHYRHSNGPTIREREREQPPSRPPFVQSRHFHRALNPIDLTLKAQEALDHSDPEFRNHLIVCRFRNSDKSFHWIRIPLGYTDLDSKGEYLVLETDREFFRAMRAEYKSRLRGPWRRMISFKTVSTVRLLKYGKGSLEPAKQNDKLFSPTFMEVFLQPDEYLADDTSEWTKWFYGEKTKEEGLDLALELTEDYDASRVFGMAGFVLASLLILSAIWVLEGGDAAYMSTVMSFILTFLAAIIGLTGLWDWLDKGHMQAAHDTLVQ